MRIGAVILAVTLLPGVNVLRPYPGPYDPPRAEVLRHMATAETLRVFRLGDVDFEGHSPSRPAAPGWLAGYKVLGEGRVSRAWRRRMVEILSDSTHYAHVIIESNGPQELYARFGLRFSGGGRVTEVVFLTLDRVWTLWSGAKPQPSGFFEPDGEEIVSLWAGAFPGDSAIARMRPDGQLASRSFERVPPGPAPLHEMPRLLQGVPPRYPQAAQAAKREGVVMIQVTVGTDGRVRLASVQRSAPGFDEAALEAVRRWRFVPALDAAGRPVECHVVVPVRFQLDGRRRSD